MNLFAGFDGKLTNRAPSPPRAAQQSAEEPTQSTTDRLAGQRCIWLCLNPCCSESSATLFATGPSTQTLRVRTGTKKKKTLCGASKTPHRGQLRDSPAPETINWNRVNWIAGAGHKTNIRAALRHRLGRRPCGKPYWA